MAFCSNCGQPVVGDSSFCSNCGAPLGNGTSKHKKKLFIKLNKKMVIGIILLLSVLGIIFYNPAKNLIIRRDPYNWLLYGIKETAQQKNMDFTTKIKMSVNVKDANEEDEKVKDFMQNMSIKIDTKQNYDYQRYSSDISILYNNVSLVSGSFYCDNDMIYLSLPGLYDSGLYIKTSDLNKLAQNSPNSKSINYNSYKQLLNTKDSLYFKNIKKDYYEFFKYNLDGSLLKQGDSLVTVNSNGQTSAVPCKILSLNLTNDKIASLIQAVLTKIANDPNIKGFTKEKIEQFLYIAQSNNDLESFNISKDDIDYFKKNFNSEYDDYTKELKNDAPISSSDVPVSVNMNLKLDKKNIIRGIDTNINYEDTEESGGSINANCETVINALGSKVLIDRPNYSKAVNLATINEDDMNEIIYNIQNNFQNIIEDKVD